MLRKGSVAREEVIIKGGTLAHRQVRKNMPPKTKLYFPVEDVIEVYEVYQYGANMVLECVTEIKKTKSIAPAGKWAKKRRPKVKAEKPFNLLDAFNDYPAVVALDEAINAIPDPGEDENPILDKIDAMINSVPDENTPQNAHTATESVDRALAKPKTPKTKKAGKKS